MPSTLSKSFFLVSKLTMGTTTSDTAIAITPISGDFDAANAKLFVADRIIVPIATVKKPAIIPAKEPILVIFFEYKPHT